MTLDELKPLVEAKLITFGQGWRYPKNIAEELGCSEAEVQAALEALSVEGRAHQNAGIGYHGWTKPRTPEQQARYLENAEYCREHAREWDMTRKIDALKEEIRECFRLKRRFKAEREAREDAKREEKKAG